MYVCLVVREGGINFQSLLSKIVAWLNSRYESQISSVVSRDV